jgi:two-component system, cell cycle response regulator
VRYKVALQGFDRDERRALIDGIEQTRPPDPGYEYVGMLAEADLVIADGELDAVTYALERQGRTGTTAFVGLLAPTGARVHLNRPLDLAQVLWALARLATQAGIEPGGVARARERARFVQADPPGEETGATEAERVAAKAAARQAARRARLAPMPPPAASANVLVLDGAEAECDALCRLLDGFGFCTYPVSSVEQAAFMTRTTAFAAAFLDLRFDADDAPEAIGLCHLIRQAQGSDAPCALIVVCDRIDPTDRIRAELAGCDSVLAKPLGRGEVAGALEACGIGLPADARQR